MAKNIRIRKLIVQELTIGINPSDLDFPENSILLSNMNARLTLSCDGMPTATALADEMDKADGITAHRIYSIKTLEDGWGIEFLYDNTKYKKFNDFMQMIETALHNLAFF